MTIASVVLVTWLTVPLASAAPRTQILPFTPATPDTNAQAVKELEGLYRDAMKRVVGDQLVSSGQTREELQLAATSNQDLRMVTSENVRQLPALFNGGPLHVTEVRGTYPDVVATFRAYDGETRALRAMHVERFALPGSLMAQRLDVIARFMAEARVTSGALEVQCTSGNGQVRVDGHEVLQCPGGVRVTPLAPGTYLMALTGGGPTVDQMEASVVANRVTTVAVVKSGDRSVLAQEGETRAMPGETGTPLVASQGAASTSAPVEKPAAPVKPEKTRSPLLYVGAAGYAVALAAFTAGLFALMVGVGGLVAYPRADQGHFAALPGEPGVPVSLGATALGVLTAAGVVLAPLGFGLAAVCTVVVLKQIL